MNNNDVSKSDRRKFLKLVSGSAALVPLAALGACSGDKQSPADTGSESGPQSSPPPKPAKEAPAGSSSLPHLSEDNAQAKALAYRHDATTVDKAANPRYEPGQLCSNCALYLGKPGSDWGGCSIFPGKAVNANGWCNVYAPKAS